MPHDNRAREDDAIGTDVAYPQCIDEGQDAFQNQSAAPAKETPR